MNWHQRADTTNTVLRRFRKKPFSWEGSANCIHLVRAQLAAFGYPVGPVPRFRTAIGAKRALHKRGFTDLPALMDSLLPRISPAEMWPGDVAFLQGPKDLDHFGALVISDGAGSLLGWHDSDLSGLRVMSLNKSDRIAAAWRV